MTRKIHDKWRRQELLSQLDDNGIKTRWQQLRVVCNRTGRYQQTVTDTMMARWDPRLHVSVQTIWVISSILTLLIAARIGLKAVTMHPGTPLGHFIVALTDILLRPFSATTETLNTVHISVLELRALNALIIYPFAAWCLVKLLQFFYASYR